VRVPDANWIEESTAQALHATIDHQYYIAEKKKKKKTS
jgi:hypothetical protein